MYHFSWEQLHTTWLAYGVSKDNQLTFHALIDLGVKYGKFGRHLWDVNVLEAASRDLLVVGMIAWKIVNKR